MGFPGGALVKDLPANARDLETQETWVWFLGWEDPLEKEMATHSSILSWKISWRETSGRLQSMGSQRVRHDWVHAHIHIHTHTHTLTDQCWFFFSCRKNKYFHSFLFLRFLSPAVRLAFSFQGHKWRHSFIYSLEKGRKCLKAWKAYNM